MSKLKAKKTTAPINGPETLIGTGGEIQQQAGGVHPPLTTDQGMPIGDNQNSLRGGRRGPTLLDDFILREKITNFDHERIPERVVHARGSAAHGYFELTESLADISSADIFQRVGEKTPLFARFSTVAGNKGSTDLARDVRGFAVKFYTKQGNWDLVGNSIPVFFIQDAIKFPDLIHAAKQDPDRGFPQAQTAHDTFWDFISLTPEAAHMIMWVMSDRGIPRSLRMMEGFGIHSFRMVSAEGKSSYVKFHWRPTLGMQSVGWDDARTSSGADPDYHRRDMWDSIVSGAFPEWELGLQVFDDAFLESFDFDLLDPTKIVPEEILPLRIVGRMVLDRNPTNFHAETEQVAFCTSNIVPGLDFSNDPLLQGRNHSYLDTQLKRLGGPNFHQLPINRSHVEVRNNQRDGHMQMGIPKGQVDYEPSLLGADGPRASVKTGFSSFPAPIEGRHARIRSDTFKDHFSQARQFFFSQTKPEQDHIVAALIFELSKCEVKAVRERMLAQLANIDAGLVSRIAAGLGMKAAVAPAPAAAPTRTDLAPSLALSILAKAKPTFEGRTVGCLVSDGVDAAMVHALLRVVQAAMGKVKIIASTVGGVTVSDGSTLEADFQLAGGPSVLFDAIAVIVSETGAAEMAADTAAVAFVHDAFAHLKVIGHTAAAAPLLKKAGVKSDKAVIMLGAGDDPVFVQAIKEGKFFAREPHVRKVF